MSLFERVQNRRYDKEELLETRFTSKEKEELARKAIKLGTTPGRLTRDVERGIQAVDKPATKDLDKFSRGDRFTRLKGGKERQGYMTGEPFQPDDADTPSGKYPTTGKGTIRRRLRYKGLESKKGVSVDDVKNRLVKRVSQANIPGIGQDEKKAREFIDKATANQKLTDKNISGLTNKKVTGSLAKGNLKFPGDKSSLYKTLKRDLELREPTVKGKSGGKLPMIGDYDKNVPGGRTGTKAQQAEYDKVARAGKKKFDAEIRQKAKLPKSVTVGGKKIDLTRSITSGTGVKIDPKTGKKSMSNPFSRKELYLQYKADKMRHDFGGKFIKRDETSTGVNSPKEMRDKLKKLKRELDTQNRTITSPKSGGQVPATASNLKKFGYVKQPLTSKRKGQVAKKSFKNFMKGAGNIVKKSKYGKIALGALAVAGTVYGASKLFGGKKQKAVAGTEISGSRLRDLPTATYMSSKTGRPIEYTYGASKEKNPYGRIGSLESSKKLAAGIKDKSIYLSKFKTPGKKT